MIEELYDTLVEVDPESRIEKTRYPSVVLVYSNIDPAKLAKAVYSGFHAFMKRFTPAMTLVEIHSDTDNGLTEFYTSLGHHISLLKELGAETTGINLITSIRGPLKDIITRSSLENHLSRSSLIINRRSKLSLIVESVDSMIFIASGITRYCGPSCITVTM